jgi:hypothetical protein
VHGKGWCIRPAGDNGNVVAPLHARRIVWLKVNQAMAPPRTRHRQHGDVLGPDLIVVPQEAAVVTQAAVIQHHSLWPACMGRQLAQAVTCSPCSPHARHKSNASNLMANPGATVRVTIQSTLKRDCWSRAPRVQPKGRKPGGRSNDNLVFLFKFNLQYRPMAAREQADLCPRGGLPGKERLVGLEPYEGNYTHLPVDPDVNSR